MISHVKLQRGNRHKRKYGLGMAQIGIMVIAGSYAVLRMKKLTCKT